MSTLVGTSLNGRYRLEARIAAGGMSTVYRAYQHAEVAIDSRQAGANLTRL